MHLQVPADSLEVARAFGVAVPDELADGLIALELEPRLARLLAGDPRVRLVEPDWTVSVPAVEESSFARLDAAKSWGPILAQGGCTDGPRDRINQVALPLDNRPCDGTATGWTPHATGAGIHIAAIDTGLDLPTPVLAGRIGEGWSAYGGEPWDDAGHGTGVAGVVAGLTHGVALEAIVHPVKVLRADGRGDYSDIIRSVYWWRDLVVARGWSGRAVANLSLAGPPPAALNRALCELAAAGIVVVVAAGNDGRDACGFSPRRVAAPAVIAVGGTELDDRRWAGSNYGRCVSIWAPSVRVPNPRPGGRWNFSTGTSFAAPLVAGAVALCLERGWEPWPCLQQTATDGVVGDARGGVPRPLFVAIP